MNNIIEYNGYIGSVEFSEQDAIFFGKVIGIRTLVSYEGKDAQSLINDFHNAVDCYIENCKKIGKEPEKAYKGSFNIRISPRLHRQAALIAAERQMTLNSFVESSIKQAVNACSN